MSINFTIGLLFMNRGAFVVPDFNLLPPASMAVKPGTAVAREVCRLGSGQNTGSRNEGGTPSYGTKNKRRQP